VLIPYLYPTADPQTANARFMADAGVAVVIPDAELTGPRLAQEVGHLLADPTGLVGMGRAAGELATPHAAAEIAAEVLSAAKMG
jgi:UDP-N-acetylglucosamine--N-acetylmuramyl-(pentapeptide) pyrophosphoryl-undecaprenol N-acetylglucosamine transferase